MERHTFVLSDVHLAEAEPSEGPWMRWRQPRWFPDDELRDFAEHVLATVAEDDEVDVVFNGDTFEFEGPRVVDGETRFDDPPRTEHDSVATTERILRDHPVFVRAVAALVRAGIRVVFVIGNHDAQLAFPGVQQVLRRAFNGAARELDESEIAARVHVRPWFFQTDDGVHIEHGHQYDAYCSFRDPLHPFAHDAPEIQPTVGSVAFRHIVSRMGYSNANDDRSLILSATRYVQHWARHYLFSSRSLVLMAALGAVKVAAKMLARRPNAAVERTIRERAASMRAEFAERHGLDRDALERHAALFAVPIEHDAHRLIRELRADHVVCAGLGISGLVLSAFKPRAGLVVAASSLILAIASELARPARGPIDEYTRVAAVRRRIARIYGARAVVFGHTHIPHESREDGLLELNTGSWASRAPSADEPEDASHPHERPVVWLRRRLEDGASLEGGLVYFGGTPSPVRDDREPLFLGDLDGLPHGA